MVEEQPRDWNTRNTLGDLYIRAGRSPTRRSRSTCTIADHLMHEGFFPKAAALYKKILKIKPDDESVPAAPRRDLARSRGCWPTPRRYFRRRRQPAPRARRSRPAPTRSSSASARSIPSDFDARTLAAQTLAADRRRGRGGDAVPRRCTPICWRRAGAPRRCGALREAVRAQSRTIPTGASTRRAQPSPQGTPRPRRPISIATSRASDPGAADGADGDRAALRRPGRRARDHRAAASRSTRRCAHGSCDLAWTLAPASPEAAFVCIDTAVDAELAGEQLHGRRGDPAGVRHPRVRGRSTRC